MAMGGKKALDKKRTMGQGEILQNPGRKELGICRHRKSRRWNTKGAHLAARVGYANSKACQDQSVRQSARPKMGTVFRVPVGLENAELVTGTCKALPCLAKARRHVFYLSVTHHKEHPLGRSSHCEKTGGRVGCCKQSSNAPPPVS